MKKYIIAVGFIILIVGLSGCISQILTNSDLIVSYETIQEHAQMTFAEFSPLTINSNLDTLAVALAKVVNSNQDMKQFIWEEVGKQFDGDYDALYEIIADISLENGTLRENMQSQLKGFDVNKITSTIPLLNLSIPVNYDKWLAYDEPIYVVPLRYDIDENEILYYVGYDQKGNSKLFDAKVIPDELVLVIGINERLDYVMETQKGIRENASRTTVQSTSDGSITRTEILQGIYITNYMEGIFRGKPEIYVLVVVGNNNIYKKFFYEKYKDIVKLNTWLTINEPMFTYSNLPDNMQYCIQLREYDGTPHVEYNVSESFYYDGQTRLIRATFSTAWGIGSGDDNYYSESLLVPFNHVKDGSIFWMNKGAVKIGYTL